MPRLSNRRAIYTLEVTLRGSEPRIWRRVLVPRATTLDRLHEIVQTTMLWEGYHLYEFQVGGGEEGYGATRYGVYEPEYMDEEPPIDATRTRLAEIAPAVGATFVYAYDFGDNWRHDIAVTDIGKPDKRRHYPLCVAGEWAGPPEDCGGVGATVICWRPWRRDGARGSTTCCGGWAVTTTPTASTATW